MSIIAQLTKIGETVKQGIINNIQQKGLRNTGQTEQSIQVEVVEAGTKIILTVSGAAHLIALESGAKPITKETTGDYVDSIAAWGQSKLGLNQKEALGLGFAMLRKRVGDGIGGKTTAPDGSYIVPNPFNAGGVLSDTVNDQTINELVKGIVQATVQTFRDIEK